MDPKHLRQEARHCRLLAEKTTDARARVALLTLAAEYEQKAEDLEKDELGKGIAARVLGYYCKE